MKFIRAKSLSYGVVRPYKNVKAIVIHYTGNKGDTAVGNCNYFRHGNQRQAGAHIFVDQHGGICKSVPLHRPAWSVGVFFTHAGGGAKYWGELNNYNTVSIEMCDCATRDPSPEMIKALKKAIKYIRKHCKNATKLVRHWDICGKQCPGRMSGGPGTKGYERWEKLLIDLGEKDPPKKTTKPKKTSVKVKPKKTNEEIAKEVIAGKWGNGETRKKKLEEAGYNYATIQRLVNKLLK